MVDFRRDKVVYALAVGFLALLALGSYLIVDSMVARQQHMATVLNVSGRQRMLSQRVALLSQQLISARTPDAKESLRAQLQESIDLMRRSHRDLVEGSLALGIDPPKRKELKDIYFAPPHDLGHRVPEYLDSADQVVSAIQQGASAPAVKASAEVVVAASKPVLESLDVAVSQYATDSEAVFRQSQIRILFVTCAMLIALATEALFIFTPLIRRMRSLVNLAQSDPLTGCYNRRSFIEAAERDFKRSRRTGSPLSVIFFDIDHFKRINDLYGHSVGDAVIMALTKAVTGTIRTSDMLGRLGGEEFVILLPDTDSGSACLVAEKLRAVLEDVEVKAEAVVLRFTASFGVSQIAEQDQDPLSLIERADAWMYEAKNAGRNCVRSDRIAI